jgi:ATP-dependent protease ClpP protease subunit
MNKLKKIFLITLLFFIFTCNNLLAVGIFSFPVEDHYEYSVFLDTNIIDSPMYRQLNVILEKAIEGDIINFYINTDGGNLSICLQLCYFIRNSRATTIAHIIKAISAGGMIAFSCNEIVVDEYSILMIHSFKMGQNYNSIIFIDNEIEFLKELNEKIITDLFGKFLKEWEKREILKYGKEIYFIGEEIKKRLGKIDDRK